MDNKKAFTVAELVFVFVFTGVVSIIALHTIKNHAVKYFTRYYAAYDALNKAVYNTYTDTYCRVKGFGPGGGTDCVGADQIEKGRPFPEQPRELCKRLREYLNATEEKDCSDGVITNAEKEEFNDENLQFAVTNGFRFYFSKMGSASIEGKDIGYFIVYIDLDGKKGRNNADFPDPDGIYLPDIVPFIATTTGDVVPVGYPCFDKDYVSARIVNDSGNQSKSYTLDEARQLAFGHNEHLDMPLTMMDTFNRVLPGRVQPPPDTPVLGIGDAGTEYMGCMENTYACTVKIDENMGIRH